MELKRLENCGRFRDFLGTLRVTPVYWPKKGPKSDRIIFKICMSPLYSLMKLSTKEHRRGEGF